METQPSDLRFAEPVRLRLSGGSVGLLRSVEEAIDWIDEQRGATAAALQLAKVSLHIANDAHIASDARSADLADAGRAEFVTALRSLKLLVK